jgi:hypothetical protein
MKNIAEYFLDRATAVLEQKRIEVSEARMESKALFIIDMNHEVCAIVDMRTGIMIKPDANPYSLSEDDIISIIPIQGATKCMS